MCLCVYEREGGRGGKKGEKRKQARDRMLGISMKRNTPNY